MWATPDLMVRGEEHLREFYLSALRRLMHESSPACAGGLEAVRRRRLSG